MRTGINILDRITLDELVNTVLADAGIKPTDPIIDITDALYEWALDNSSSVDDDTASEWAISWAADIVGRLG